MLPHFMGVGIFHESSNMSIMDTLCNTKILYEHFNISILKWYFLHFNSFLLNSIQNVYWFFAGIVETNLGFTNTYHYSCVFGKCNYRVLVSVSVCVFVCVSVFVCVITQKEIDLGT